MTQWISTQVHRTRRIAPASGIWLLMAIAGCASSVTYIPLHSTKKISLPFEVDLLSEIPTRKYTALGIVRLDVGDHGDAGELPDSVRQMFKLEASKHGADAVVVPYDRSGIGHTNIQGKNSNSNKLEGLAIVWKDSESILERVAPFVKPEDSTAWPAENGNVIADTPPVKTYWAKPQPPDRATANLVSGDLWVEALVGTDGRVWKARILKPSGFELGFEEAALEAAMKDRYNPAMNRGKPVAVWISYKVSFKFKQY